MPDPLLTGGLVAAVTIAFLSFVGGYWRGQRTARWNADTAIRWTPQPPKSTPLPASSGHLPALSYPWPLPAPMVTGIILPAPERPGRHRLETVTTQAFPVVAPAASTSAGA